MTPILGSIRTLLKKIEVHRKKQNYSYSQNYIFCRPSIIMQRLLFINSCMLQQSNRQLFWRIVSSSCCNLSFCFYHHFPSHKYRLCRSRPCTFHRKIIFQTFFPLDPQICQKLRNFRNGNELRSKIFLLVFARKLRPLVHSALKKIRGTLGASFCCNTERRRYLCAACGLHCTVGLSAQIPISRVPNNRVNLFVLAL